MTQNTLNLEKEAHLLSGKERARLILKDSHERLFGDKKGFLTKTEKDALMRFPDYKTKNDYTGLIDLSLNIPIIMACITEAYLRFKYYYETLKKAHLLLNFSDAVGYLSKLVKEHIADEKAKEEALKITDLIQVIETNSEGKAQLKDNLHFIEEIIPQVYGQACYFVSMKKIVGRINEEVGFDIFVGRRYNEAYQTYIEEVKLCINEHNCIMEKAGTEIPELKKYIIPEPTYNTDVYLDWAERLFKGKT